MNFLDFINQLAPQSIVDILAYVHITPAHFIVLSMLIILLSVKNILKPYLRKILKLKFYRLRANVFYRLLFLRFDTLANPFMRLIDFIILHQISRLFIGHYVFNYFIFFGYLFFFIWCSYQISKFIIHLNLAMKILKKRVNRRRMFYHLYLNTAKVIIAIIAIIATLSKFGVDLSTLLTSLGVGGAILAFSAKNTLTNFFDSIILITEDAFRQGDWIETKDISGSVAEPGLLSTKIRTFDNALVTIPNSILAHEYIKNWTVREFGRRIKFDLRLEFSSDTAEIENVINQIRAMLLAHPKIVDKKQIKKFIKKTRKKYQDEDIYNIEDKYGIKRNYLVYFHKIDRYSMNILIYAFCASTDWEDWLKVKEEVLKKVLNIVKASKLDLAYPTQNINIQKFD